ncbi:hypothetical protein DLAC_04374 [Tieghemostelium lacteum]|uniref:Man1/Src1-like C-terminal domain-containing protein n=1 Tax=Tieghemostelium lacteum TaxID=361077 RepID=A0A151ZJK7_TIELA|nr:hypothetical protein DLAC_04374 [Tieghemostelium lacteum]|eukprot:KYQ94095.1 hypothetical protein DLAC_04374 [Tieghemostelium lacteum]
MSDASDSPIGDFRGQVLKKSSSAARSKKILQKNEKDSEKIVSTSKTTSLDDTKKVKKTKLADDSESSKLKKKKPIVKKIGDSSETLDEIKKRVLKKVGDSSETTADEIQQPKKKKNVRLIDPNNTTTTTTTKSSTSNNDKPLTSSKSSEQQYTKTPIKKRKSTDDIKKQVRRKSIETGNIFQVDQHIKEIEEEESKIQVDDNDNDKEERNQNNFDVSGMIDNGLDDSSSDEKPKEKKKTTSTTTTKSTDKERVSKQQKQRHSIATTSSISSKSGPFKVPPYDTLTKSLEKHGKTTTTKTDTQSELAGNNKKEKEKETRVFPKTPLPQHPPPSYSQTINNNSNNNNNHVTFQGITNVNNPPSSIKPKQRHSISSTGPSSVSGVSVPTTPVSNYSNLSHHFYPKTPYQEYYNYDPNTSVSEDSPPMKPNFSANLNASENNISFDTDSKFLNQNLDDDSFNLVDDDLLLYQQQQQQQQQQYHQQNVQKISSRADYTILDDPLNKSWKYYLYITISSVFYCFGILVLLGFLFLPQILYCDHTASDNILVMNEQNFQCESCPWYAECYQGQFKNCIDGYYSRWDLKSGRMECEKDHTDSNLFETVANATYVILQKARGNYLCGYTESPDVDQHTLKQMVLKNFWLKKSRAEQHYQRLTKALLSNSYVDRMAVNELILEDIGSSKDTVRDDLYWFHSKSQSIKPWRCQSREFTWQLLTDNLGYIALVFLSIAIGVLVRQRMQANEEMKITVEKYCQSIYKFLRHRKNNYEEAYISEPILRDEIFGPYSQGNPEYNKIWDLAMQSIFRNARVLVTPRLIRGETVTTFEWLDDSTPKSQLSTSEQSSQSPSLSTSNQSVETAQQS